jgi:hypothetical protein
MAGAATDAGLCDARRRMTDVDPLWPPDPPPDEPPVDEPPPHKGIPERFCPSLHLSWYSRGENASGKRRAELRKVAESRIEALEKKARYDIDNWCVKTQAALIKDSLTSAQAAAFLEQMPTAEQLMPTLDASRIASLLPGGNPLIEVAGR